MMIIRRRTLGLRIVLAAALVCLLGGADWMQFRGTRNVSVTSESDLPVRWKADNATWNLSLLGRCVSGPIVVKGHVITTSSSGIRNERLHIWMVNADTGRLEWHRQLWATGRTYCHPLTSMASPTPASDGVYLYVLFASNDLVCLDLDGNVQWMRSLGTEFPLAFDDRGLGSSPLVVGDTVVIQIECQGDSAVLGIDGQTGETRWRHALPRATNWCSPAVFPSADKDLLLVQTLDRLMVMEPKSGKILDRFVAAGGSIPSLAVDGDTVFLPAKGLTALRYQPGAEPELLWRENRLGPQSASPVVANGKIYVLRSPNILVCGDTSSGKLLWRKRLKGERFWATPVLAGDMLYTVNIDGLVQVIDVSGTRPDVLAENDMGEQMLGSPAVADGAIYLRGIEHLWKIEKGGTSSPVP